MDYRTRHEIEESMQHRYQAVVGGDVWNPLIIYRWPAYDVDGSNLCEAMFDVMPKCIDMEAAVVFDVVPSDFPTFTSLMTVENLELAYNGDRLVMPLFDLFDYRNGKFVNIQKGMRSNERLLPMRR